MAVNINVPSQVKTYANLAAFPATGALKTIYIAEDTNKTYRWTGSVYVEVSASAASGITIGSTAIASGVVGRVLFEGAGNVVQESSSLFWDNTNARLGVGTSSPTQPIDVNGNGRIQGQLTTGGGTPLVLTGESFAFQTVVASGPGGSVFGTNGVNPSFIDILSGSNFWHFSNRSASGGGNNRFGIYNANFSGTTASYTSELFTIHTSGNVGIGTTTDAGFRLDVNGTARVQGNTSVSLNQNAGTNLTISNTNSGSSAEAFLRVTASNGSFSFSKVSSAYPTYKQIVANDSSIYNGTIGDISIFNDFATGRIKFGAGGSSTAQMTLFSTGNVGINTTTDAGFRLDVNGTARVSGLLSASGGLNVTNNNPVQFTTGFSGLSGNCIYSEGSSTLLFMNRNSLVANFYNGGSSANQGIQFGYGITAAQPPNTASALLDLTSTTKGFLPPRMTTTQKNAIATPAAGLMVYDTTLNVISYYNGTMWI